MIKRIYWERSIISDRTILNDKSVVLLINRYLKNFIDLTALTFSQDDFFQKVGQAGVTSVNFHMKCVVSGDENCLFQYELVVVAVVLRSALY